LHSTDKLELSNLAVSRLTMWEGSITLATSFTRRKVCLLRHF
jgi:hypothetical protein